MALELQQRGFRNARPLAGGYNAWRDNGLPLVDVELAQNRATESV